MFFIAMSQINQRVAYQQHVMSYYMKELEKMMSKRYDIAERYDTDDSEVFPFVWNRLQEALLEGIEILS